MNDRQIAVLRNAIFLVIKGMADGISRWDWNELGRAVEDALDKAAEQDRAERAAGSDTAALSEAK